MLVLVLNYKMHDSCKPLISYVKLLMGQLGPRDVVTTAAQTRAQFGFFCHGAQNLWRHPCENFSYELITKTAHTVDQTHH